MAFLFLECRKRSFCVPLILFHESILNLLHENGREEKGLLMFAHEAHPLVLNQHRKRTAKRSKIGGVRIHFFVETTTLTMVEPKTRNFNEHGELDNGNNNNNNNNNVEHETEAYCPLTEEDPYQASTSPHPSPPLRSSSQTALPQVPPSSWLEQTLFFTCGVGTSICYIATLSSLVYFKILYGATSFPLLNLAIYLPLLPISLAQAVWDQDYDLKYTSRNTFLVRGVIGFSLGIVGTYRMITSDRLPSVVINALLQGTGGAILYGTLNQLASLAATTVVFVEDKNKGQLQTAVSAGVQASLFLISSLGLVCTKEHAFQPLSQVLLSLRYFV
jgi:hypothetical protein